MEHVVTGLYIVACVLLFSFAIFIHELGHLVVAKGLGLEVEAFSIGFGKVLCRWKAWGIEWRLSLLPLGGYVSLPQLDPEGTKAIQGTQDASSATIGESNERRIEKSPDLPPWKQILVALAGPMGNIVLAVALAFLLAAIPSARFGELSTKVSFVPESGPAHEAGMRAGDEVLSVGGHAIRTWSDLQTEVQISGGKATPFVVRRGKETLTLNVTPARHKASDALYILAFSETNVTRSAAWMPARDPMRQLAWDAGQIFRVLKALATPKESKAAAKALGGPVMIAEGLYRQVRSDFTDGLGFLRFLNVNLAILNLLPIPVLDGGLIMFALIALVFRRRVPPKVVSTLTMAFMVLLLALMAFLIYRDSVRSWRIHHQDVRESCLSTNVTCGVRGAEEKPVVRGTEAVDPTKNDESQK